MSDTEPRERLHGVEADFESGGPDRPAPTHAEVAVDTRRLWRDALRDADSGLDALAERYKITREALIPILAAAAVKDIRTPPWAWIRNVGKRAQVVLVLIILFVVLALIVVWVANLWQSQRVMVATKGLDAGHTLQRGDLKFARMPLESDYFVLGTEKDEESALRKLDGLLLSQALPAGGALRPRDVLRLQLVAMRDIVPGSAISRDAVGLAWTAYQEDAAMTMNEVHGRRARQSIRRGAVILRSNQQFEGMATPEPPEPMLLPVPIGVSGLSANLLQGQQVSLLFSPRDRTVTAPQPYILWDVPVREVRREASGAMVIVEVSRESVTAVLPYMGASDVFVLAAGASPNVTGATPRTSPSPPGSSATVTPTMPTVSPATLTISPATPAPAGATMGPTLSSSPIAAPPASETPASATLAPATTLPVGATAQLTPATVSTPPVTPSGTPAVSIPPTPGPGSAPYQIPSR